MHPIPDTHDLSWMGDEIKQEEHVPRHIELTAVLREILKQIRE